MKKILAIALVAVAIVALTAGAAFAEGYNNDGTGKGFYQRPAYFSGPHGGYTTTTNKCQDCHSTHYALGSFMLLRANSREAACDYCHGGGGGATVNIMMDNDYRSGAYNMALSSAVSTTTSGYGTGHTLGFTGNAPVDTNSGTGGAFNAAQGFACFDCHTPHGNSARVLEAFGTPSKPAGDGNVNEVYGVSFMTTQMYRIQESMKVDLGITQGAPEGAGIMPSDLSRLPSALKGNAGGTEIGAWVHANLQAELDAVYSDAGTPSNPLDDTGFFPAWMDSPNYAPTPAQMGAWVSNGANFAGDNNGDGYKYMNATGMGALFALFGAPDMDLINLFSAWNVYWGTDIAQGNTATCFMNMGDFQVATYAGNPFPGNYNPVANPELEVWHKPLFGKGRFLLLKNPDNEDDVAGFSDMGLPTVDTNIGAAGKKVAIDWEWPIGPAASWGPFFSLTNNERFPLAFPWAPKGVAMENEMCTSCHDGAAGMSEQSASVWSPKDNNYITAYSHDSNARGCARQQYLNPQDGDNMGPHCANCHTGASGCQTCHSESGENWVSFGRSAFATNSAMAAYEGMTTYRGPAAVRTSAVSNINGQCLDGGFSYPHRTLGANMLKDSLYGVDFDGTPISAGATRTANGGTAGTDNNNLLTNANIAADLGSWFAAGDSFESTRVVNTTGGSKVDNLDSVCIDCHGNATYWTGDSAPTSFTAYNPLSGGTQSWSVVGWSLLLKGLP